MDILFVLGICNRTAFDAAYACAAAEVEGDEVCCVGGFVEVSCDGAEDEGVG